MRRDLALVAIGALLGVLAAVGATVRANPPAARPHDVTASCGCAPLADASDLPLVVRRAPHPSRTMAVMISGDGGWQAMEKELAAGLNARGVSVVGLVAPKYFGKRKTPDEAACDLRRIIEYYSIYWHAPKVIVVGYSRGAGVAPFMISRLPAQWQDRVEAVAFIGLEKTIDFEVKPVDVFRTGPAPHDVPVAAEIEKLRGKNLICIYGVRDDDNLCRELSPLLVTGVPQAGGHHLAGSYDQLAGTILKLSHT